MRRPSPLTAIFLTVFLDLFSFGLVIPDIQLRGEKLGAHGWIIGMMIATFSIAQLAFAPYLGSLSDRVGRRKILILTCLLSASSYLCYSQAHSLVWIFIARALGGIGNANIPVAFAYIADITTPENRSRGMGMIGAAFGLGFIMGPVVGANLVKLGGGQPFLLGMVAMALSLMNAIYVLLYLPEPEKHEGHGAHSGVLKTAKIAIATPSLLLLLVLFFVANFAFANLESTYFRLAENQHHVPQHQAVYVLAFVGVIGALMQTVFVPRLVKKFGEPKLLRIAYILQIPALLLVPFAPFWLPQLGGALLLSVGSGLANPCLNAQISKNAPGAIQGAIFGVTQALGAVARIAAPLIGNTLFDLGHAYPYFLAGGLMVVPVLLAFRIRLDQKAKLDSDVESDPVPSH